MPVQEESKCNGPEVRMKLECNFQGQKKGPAVWGVEGGERVKEMTLERVAGTPSY